MQTMQKYKHLFFDLDHTLWDFDTNAKHALEDIFHQYKLAEKINAAFELFFEKYLYHNKILWENYQNGLTTADELKWKRMSRTLLEFKVGDEKLSKEMGVSFLELLPTKKSIFPHTVEILQYLKDKNYELHLITNGFEKTQWHKVKNSQIDHFFTHMITSEISNSMKPNKEIFEFALQKTNATKEASIMIGDNLEADIMGAINFGMDCIFVNHINAVTDIQPTYTITHLIELETIF
jgi:putative hydrolase of the HAD superfamily